MNLTGTLDLKWIIGVVFVAGVAWAKLAELSARVGRLEKYVYPEHAEGDK